MVESGVEKRFINCHKSNIEVPATTIDKIFMDAHIKKMRGENKSTAKVDTSALMNWP